MSGKSLCRACGKTFRSVACFDKHRIGDHGKDRPHPDARRCMTTDEMLAAGMAETARGWVTALNPKFQCA